MKRIVALILAILSTLAITGCKKLTKEELSSISRALSKSTASTIKNKSNSKGGKKEELDVSSFTSEDASTSSSISSSVSSVTADSSNTITSDIQNRDTTTVSSTTATSLPTPTGSATSQTITVDEALVDKVVEEFNQKEGLQFTSLSGAKDTDTVSMINLYKAPFTGEFADIDAKVMYAIDNNIKTEVDTGVSADNLEFINRYLNQLYNVKGIRIDEFRYVVDGNVFIDTTTAVNNKIILENKPYYQNIQNIISYLGIYKGMSQKAAIEKFNTYICNKVSYNTGSTDASLNTFFSGKAICNSYAQVFELLCRTVGINCRFIGGTALAPQGTYERHAWNKVTFSDGTVYYFDTCWNDADIVVNGQTFQRNNRYMFVTSFGSRAVSEDRIIGYYEY